MAGNLTTERATAGAYLADLNGQNIVDFQFSPHELDFSEDSNIVDRMNVGHYYPELVWISGKLKTFNVKMFIDRSLESMVKDSQNNDPFSDVKRFPDQNPRSDNSVDYSNGLKVANGGQADEIRVEMTSFDVSPEYPKVTNNDEKGVYPELEKVLYYIRPKGLKIPSSSLSDKGILTVEDLEISRFTPPPVVRFFYGNLWKQGYLSKVSYTLSVVNKLLVPQRMEATLEFMIEAEGILNDISQSSTLSQGGGTGQALESDF